MNVAVSVQISKLGTWIHLDPRSVFVKSRSLSRSMSAEAANTVVNAVGLHENGNAIGTDRDRSG